MKKIWVAFLFIPAVAGARGLVTGEKSVEISLSAADIAGISAEARYASLLRPRMEIGFSVSALGRIYQKEQYEIPVAQFGAAFDFSHILISARRSTLALWGDLHALLGYELVNGGKNRLDDGAEIIGGSTFIWGGMAALRLEIPLSRRCALSVRVRGRYTPPSYTSALHFETGIGIRINL